MPSDIAKYHTHVKEIFELSVSENEKTREKNEEDLEVTNKKHEKSKNKMSRSSKIEPIEVKKINPNNTNKSNTNKSNTKSNHIFRKDMEEKITIEQQIRTNIDYDSLLLTHREDVEQIDEIVNLISEILVKGDKRKIYIAGDMLDCEYVKERFRELNNKHIRYIREHFPYPLLFFSINPIPCFSSSSFNIDIAFPLLHFNKSIMLSNEKYINTFPSLSFHPFSMDNFKRSSI